MLADKLRAASLSARPLPEFVSSNVNSVRATSVTVTAPPGIQDGDLLVAFCSKNDTSFNLTPPSGFTVIGSENSTQMSTFLAVKVAASESGNYTFTWSGLTASNTAAILVYRNATRVNTVGSEVSTNGTSVAASSITPTFHGVLLGVFYSTGSDFTITSAPNGMTQRVYSTGTKGATGVYEQSPQEASATGTKAVTFSGTANCCGILLQITNEPTVVPEFVASTSTSTPAASSVSSLTINKPTGTVEGDLMVAVMGNSYGYIWSGDTDWVEVAERESGQRPSLRVAYKVAGASEPSSYTFTSATASAGTTGSILTYRYASYDTIGSFAFGASPLILPSISPSESQSILIAVGAIDSASTTLDAPTSMTARVTDNNTTALSYIVCDQTAAKGPTGTRSMSTGSTSYIAGIMLAIKPTRSL